MKLITAIHTLHFFTFTKFSDQSSLTQDEGNTNLHLYFLSTFNEDGELLNEVEPGHHHEKRVQDELTEIFLEALEDDDEYSHDIRIISQNSDLIIIHSFTK